MPCFKPLKAYHGQDFHPSGKRKLVFDPGQTKLGKLAPIIPLTCGQCLGCKLERSRQWAMRGQHEASVHEDNIFITLTYDDEHRPAYGSLVVSHFQKFIKRLRYKFPDQTIRYLQCGEYGELLGRPHYHACLFGFKFPDQKLLAPGKRKTTETVKINGRKETRPLRIPQQTTDDKLSSEILNKLWGKGRTEIGAVNFNSIAYLARYCVKKINGPLAQKEDPDTGLTHYERQDEYTGEVITLHPEYNTMSRRPGIGKKWFDKFKSDLYPSDFLVTNGHEARGPKYYDTLYELEDPDELEIIKAKRVQKARENVRESTPKRLAVRLKCAQARASQSTRNKL